MLTVTEPAAAQLDAMLAKSPEGVAVRFIVNGNALEPRVDTPREGDQEFRHGDKTVLLVEPTMAEALTDHVLDARITEQGAQLSLRQGPPDSSETEAPAS